MAHWDVFISYSHNDMSIMRIVYTTLRNYGLNVWIDEELIPGTPAWSKVIGSVLENTRCLVVLMSPNSKISEWVDREIDYARTHGLYIIPILAFGDLKKAMPFSLAGYQHTDISFNPERVLTKLAETIQNRLNTSTGSSSKIVASEHKLVPETVVEVIPNEEFIEPIPAFTSLEFVPLDELVNFQHVSEIPQSQQNPGKYPLYSVTGIQNYVDTYQFEGQHLIIPNIIHPARRVAFFVEGRFSATRSVFVASPKDSIDPEYLAFALRRIDLSFYSSGVIPRVTLALLKDLKVPIPSLSEQRNFAFSMHQLEAKIDEARQLHIETLSQLDSLLPSILQRAFRGEQ